LRLCRTISLLGYPVQPQTGFQVGPVASFPSQQGFLPSQDQQLQQGDETSLVLFKQNLQLVQENVIRLQGLARSALAGIKNAYHPGNSPAQTQADIAAIKQTLQILSDLMLHTGVGALPLVDTINGVPQNMFSEKELEEKTSHGVKLLFEKHKRSQDSAAVVANLLGPDWQAPRSAR